MRQGNHARIVAPAMQNVASALSVATVPSAVAAAAVRTATSLANPVSRVPKVHLPGKAARKRANRVAKVVVKAVVKVVVKVAMIAARSATTVKMKVRPPMFRQA